MSQIWVNRYLLQGYPVFIGYHWKKTLVWWNEKGNQRRFIIIASDMHMSGVELV